MTDRPTTTSGKVKVNYTLDQDAVEMLAALSPSKRAIGGYLSRLIRAEYQRARQGQVVAQVAAQGDRLARLEQIVADLAGVVASLAPAQAGAIAQSIGGRALLGDDDQEGG